MKENELISVVQICQFYEIKEDFIKELFEDGLIDLNTKSKSYFINLKHLPHLERIIRLNKELDVNSKGIDIILNLVEKIEELRNEIQNTRNRLSIYE